MKFSKLSTLATALNLVLALPGGAAPATTLNTSQNRTVEGQSSEINEFPFLVSLTKTICRPAGIPLGSPCTGSILSNQWILTAGHCFPSSKNEEPAVTTTSSFYILTGSADRKKGTVVEAERVYTYPAFKR